jgi:hypothetical protein
MRCSRSIYGGSEEERTTGVTPNAITYRDRSGALVRQLRGSSIVFATKLEATKEKQCHGGLYVGLRRAGNLNVRGGAPMQLGRLHCRDIDFVIFDALSASFSSSRKTLDVTELETRQRNM